MPSPEEQKDIDEMKAKTTKLKLQFFDHARDMLTYSSEQLMHSGYRNMTNAEAIVKLFQSYQKDIDKIMKEFLKKWPDD